MNLPLLPLSTALQLRMKAIMIMHGYRCRYCGGEASEADHVIPKSKGGSDAAENLVASCRSCNASKGDNLLHPALALEIRKEAFSHVPLLEMLIRTLRDGEVNARKRRHSLRPWRVA